MHIGTCFLLDLSSFSLDLSVISFSIFSKYVFGIILGSTGYLTKLTRIYSIFPPHRSGHISERWYALLLLWLSICNLFPHLLRHIHSFYLTLLQLPPAYHQKTPRLRTTTRFYHFINICQLLQR